MKIESGKYILVGQLINGLLSFIGLVVWARHAPSNVISIVLIAGSFCLLFCDLIDFGGNAWINREASQRDLPSGIVWSFLLPKIQVIFGISTVIAAYIVIVAGDYFLGFYLLITPCFLISAAYFQGFALVKNAFFAGFFAQFLERFFWISPALLVAIGMNPKNSIFIGLIVGEIISFIFIILFYSRIYRKEKHIYVDRFSVRETYRLSSKVGVASIVSDLYSLDTFLVSRFSSLMTAGDFAIIQKNRNVSVLGFNIVASRLRLRNFENQTAIKQHLQIERFLLIFNLIGLVLVISFAPLLLNIVFGEKYIELAPSLRIACFSFIFLGFISVMQALLSSFRDDVFLSYFTTVSVFFSLFAMSIGAYLLGALGACMGLGVSFVIQTLVLMLRIRERLRLIYSFE